LYYLHFLYFFALFFLFFWRRQDSRAPYKGCEYEKILFDEHDFANMMRVMIVHLYAFSRLEMRMMPIIFAFLSIS